MAPRKRNEPVPVPDAPIWTTDEVASYLRISPDMVRIEAKKKRIPGAFQIGTLWRFKAESIRQYAEAQAAA